MRAIVFGVFMLAACAAPPGPFVAPRASQHVDPSNSDASNSVSSGLARAIRADMERLDDELAAQGVVAAGIGETADLGGGEWAHTYLGREFVEGMHSELEPIAKVEHEPRFEGRQVVMVMAPRAG